MKLLLLLASLACAASVSGGSEFLLLDELILPEGGRFSSGFPDRVLVGAVSGDGSTVAGSIHMGWTALADCSGLCGEIGFVFDLTTRDRIRLPSLPSTERTYPPVGVSAITRDGGTALVDYDPNDGWYTPEAALWSGDDRRSTRLRDDPVERSWVRASDMSADGSTIVGHLLFLSEKSQRDKEPLVLVDGKPLDSLGAVGQRVPLSVTADGGTIIFNDKRAPRYGLRVVDGHGPNALVWSSDAAGVELPPARGFDQSFAHAIASEGGVAVGVSVSKGPNAVATVWTAGEASRLASRLGWDSSAFDVSRDGRLVVGVSQAPKHSTDSRGHALSEAMLWRDGEGHILEELLANEYGLRDELQGWSLTSSVAISDDGAVIVGRGFAPDGIESSWVAILAIPEPTSAHIVLSATVACLMLPYRAFTGRCFLRQREADCIGFEQGGIRLLGSSGDR